MKTVYLRDESLNKSEIYESAKEIWCWDDRENEEEGSYEPIISRLYCKGIEKTVAIDIYGQLWPNFNPNKRG